MRTKDPSIFHKTLKSLTTNLQQTLETIRAIKATTSLPYMIRVLGLDNPSPELPHSHFWTDTFNRHLHSITSGYGTFIHINHIFLQAGNSVLSPD